MVDQTWARFSVSRGVVDWSLGDGGANGIVFGREKNVGLASPRESRVVGRAGARNNAIIVVYRPLEV